MSSLKNCVLCFNDNNVTYHIISDSRKYSELCCKYFHSSFSQEAFLEHSSYLLPFCPKCYECMEELVSLNDQMEYYQKRISELVFISSLNILHRRGKRSENSNSEKKLVEFDVSSLPDFDSFDISPKIDFKEVYESSTNESQNGISENIFLDGCSDPLFLPTPITGNEGEGDNFQVEEMKYDSQLGGVSEDPKLMDTIVLEPSTRKETENKINSIIEVDSSLLPEVTLKKLKFRGENSIVTDSNNHNSVDEIDGNGKINLPIVGVKSRGGYRRTVTKRKSCSKERKSVSVPVDDCDVLTTEVSTKFDENIVPKIMTRLSSSDRNRHSNSSKKQSFQCDLCSKTFRTQLYLKIHARSHTNTRSAVRKTNFSRQNNLLHHSRISKKKGQYNCDTCKKQFSTTQNLKIHLRLHTGERSYRCDLCDKGFTYNSYLKIHKRIHTYQPDRLYECEYCEEVFSPQKDLLMHYRRVHSAERPYKCEFCEWSFAIKGCFVQHSKCHTMKKPFKCDQCNYATNKNSNLKRHKTLVHS